MDDQPKSGEVGRKAPEHTSKISADASRSVRELVTTGPDPVSLWTGQLRVLHEVTESSLRNAQDGIRLVAHTQRSAIDAVGIAHAAALRMTALWPQAFLDPARWWQAALEEGLECSRRIVALAEATAQGWSGSVERFESSAHESAREMREVVTPPPRPRAA